MLQLPELIAPTTVGAVRDVVAMARSSGEPLRIAGAGTWLRAGAPVVAQRTLSLQLLSGITEYVPGDLTITALAGTSLAELSQATAAHGQWLGLDPAGDPLGTIGATIATASSGPLAHAFGTPRDLVLGLDAVTGYGDVVRPGGRVVKNVAGFDLVRLYTGSWGTLGPITQVTLRLRALPIHDVTLAIAVDGMAHLVALLPALRANTIALMACEFIDGAAARRIGLGTDGDTILLRLGGNDRFVRGQQSALANLANCVPSDPAVWGALATLDHDAPAVVRFSGAVSALPARLARLRTALDTSGADVSIHGCIARGIARVIAHDVDDATRAILQASGPDEQRIAERLPVEWWHSEPNAFDGGLAGRIRDAFDPDRLCNRRVAIDA